MGLDRHRILNNQIVGIIVCGGKSVRMGRDKSGLMLGGQTLLESTRQRLSAVTNVVFTAGREGCDFVDAYANQGPAMALFSMLEQAQPQDGARFLVMPVDMPLCSPACLQAALQASLQRRKSVYTQNAIMPLVIHYTEAGFNTLQQRVNNSTSLSLRAFIQCFDDEALDLSQFANELINVNDQTDWAKLQVCVSGQPE